MEIKRKPGQQYLSDKIHFKTKIKTRDKEGHYIMIKRSSQEDITNIYIYTYIYMCVYIYTHTHTIETSKYIKQILTDIMGETDSNNNTRGL